MPNEENEPVGPFKTEEVLARLRAGQIQEDTVCWREGMDDWAPLVETSPFSNRLTSQRSEPQTQISSSTRTTGRTPEFLDGLQRGQTQLKAAKAEPELRLRTSLLGLARAAFAEALSISPDPSVEALLAEANRLSAQCAYESGDAAFAQRLFSEAKPCYEQVLESVPNHSAALNRLQQIDDYRRTAIAQIRRSMWVETPEVMKSVADLARSFSGDREIEQLLLQRSEQLHEARQLRARMAELANAGKWHELSQITSTIAPDCANAPGIREYVERVQRVFREFNPLLNEAEEGLTAGRLPHALGRSRQALELVSDHPRALEIHAHAENQVTRHRRRFRFVLFLVTVLVLALAGLGGWFETSESQALNAAEEHIKSGHHDDASDTLAQLAGSKYHMLLGKFFHASRLDFLTAKNTIEKEAYATDTPSDQELLHASEQLKKLAERDTAWQNRMDREFESVVQNIPAADDDYLDRSLLLAQTLNGIPVLDSEHWAAQLLEVVRTATKIPDPAHKDKLASVIVQILQWDPNSTAEVVSVLVAEDARMPYELNTGLELLDTCIRTEATLKPALVEAMRGRAEQYLTNRNYELTMKMSGAIDPGATASIHRRLLAQVGTCAQRGDIRSGIFLVNSVAEANSQLVAEAAKAYVDHLHELGNKLSELVPAVASEARKLVDASTYETSFAEAGRLVELHRYHDAEQMLEQAKEHCPPEKQQEWQQLHDRARYEGTLSLASEKLEAGDHATAIELAKQASVLSSQSKYVDPAAAKNMLRQIATDCVSQGTAALKKAVQLLAAESYEEAPQSINAARLLFERAREADPDNPDLPDAFARADTLSAECERKRKAARILELLADGEKSAKQGRWLEGIKSVEQVLELQPDHPDALQKMEEYLAKQSDPATTDLSGMWTTPNGAQCNIQVVNRAVSVEFVHLPPETGLKSAQGTWQRTGRRLEGPFRLQFTNDGNNSRTLTGSISANVGETDIAVEWRQLEKIDLQRGVFEASGYDKWLRVDAKQETDDNLE